MLPFVHGRAVQARNPAAHVWEVVCIKMTLLVIFGPSAKSKVDSATVFPRQEPCDPRCPHAEPLSLSYNEARGRLLHLMAHAVG